MAVREGPKKFRVWFRLGEVDQAACAEAVRAWAAAQKAAGVDIRSSSGGSVTFEAEENIMPGVDEASFLEGLRMLLEMQGDDPKNLFYHGDVALYPEEA